MQSGPKRSICALPQWHKWSESGHKLPLPSGGDMPVTGAWHVFSNIDHANCAVEKSFWV